MVAASANEKKLQGSTQDAAAIDFVLLAHKEMEHLTMHSIVDSLSFNHISFLVIIIAKYSIHVWLITRFIIVNIMKNVSRGLL